MPTVNTNAVPDGENTVWQGITQEVRQPWWQFHTGSNRNWARGKGADRQRFSPTQECVGYRGSGAAPLAVRWAP